MSHNTKPYTFGEFALNNTFPIESDLTVEGNARMNGRLMVDGRDVMQELDDMRDSLLLLKRDVNMESKYPRLKELKEEYEAALAKYKTMEALK